MKIFIGNDDNAIEYKNLLKTHLQKKGLMIEDHGVQSPNDPTLYADMVHQTCKALLESTPKDRGILLCGTGIGVCMTANKIPGIYAAVGHDLYSAQRHILSNDGNVLCFGASVIGKQSMLAVLDQWLTLHYEENASAPKINALRTIEKHYSAISPDQ